MTTCELEHFPVEQAFLCEDCQSIGNCSVQCPACASQALSSVARLVNREEDAADACDQ